MSAWGRGHTTAGFEQAQHQGRQVHRNGVLEVDHLYIGGVGHVHGGNDLGDTAQVVAIVGDDQGVVARVDVDGVVRTDQWAQDGQQVVGIFKVEFEDLRSDLVACHEAAVKYRTALQLGVGLGYDLVQASRIHHGVALQSQHGQELAVGLGRAHGLVGGQCDRAFYTRIHHHVASG